MTSRTKRGLFRLFTAAALTAGLAAPAAARPATPPKVFHCTVKVDGLDIFYREAGPPAAPAVLPLHQQALDPVSHGLEVAQAGPE